MTQYRALDADGELLDKRDVSTGEEAITWAADQAANGAIRFERLEEGTWRMAWEYKPRAQRKK